MTISCDLCLVGAGYAGVNALNAAVKYLKPGARVVVVDQGVGWGGMWQHAYGFVRLHQPHRMYTAGERRWNLRKPEAHLATLTEIKSHFLDIVEACVAESKVELRTLFRHHYDAHDADAAARIVRITATPISESALHDGGDDGGSDEFGPGLMPPVAIEAQRLIIATGFSVRAKRPLPFSCGAAARGGVHSLTPGDLLKPRWHAALRDESTARAPIWVVGSGKTALDTVCFLERDPATRGRVRCVSGRGTWFMNRKVFAPSPLTREGWREIYMPSLRCDAVDAFLDMFDQWDGQNGPDVYRSMGAKGHLITPIDGATCCVAGFADPEEVNTMRAALCPAAERIVRAHLLDIESCVCGDESDESAAETLRMRLRPVHTGTAAATAAAPRQQPPGAEVVTYRNIEPGSFIVNCTDNLSPDLGFRPIVDETGLVLAPQTLLGFSGPTAHFVTHAWYLGTLSDRAWRSLPRMSLHPDKENAGIRLTAAVFFSTTVFARCLPRGVRNNHHFTRSPYPRWRLLGTLRRLRRTAPALWKKIKLVVPDRFDDDVNDGDGTPQQWRAMDDAVLGPGPHPQFQRTQARL